MLRYLLPLLFGVATLCPSAVAGQEAPSRAFADTGRHPSDVHHALVVPAPANVGLWPIVEPVTRAGAHRMRPPPGDLPVPRSSEGAFVGIMVGGLAGAGIGLLVGGACGGGECPRGGDVVLVTAGLGVLVGGLIGAAS